MIACACGEKNNNFLLGGLRNSLERRVVRDANSGYDGAAGSPRCSKYLESWESKSTALVFDEDGFDSELPCNFVKGDERCARVIGELLVELLYNREVSIDLNRTSLIVEEYGTS